MLCSWRYPSQSVGAAFLCVAVSWLWIFTLDNGEWKMNGQTALVGVGEGLRVWWYDHDDDDTVDSFRKAAGSWWIKLTTLFERITVFDTGYWKLHEWRKLGKLMNHSLPNTILKLLKQQTTLEWWILRREYNKKETCKNMCSFTFRHRNTSTAKLNW